MATNTPLQSIVLTSASSSVTFSNIDQTYTDLVLIPSVKNSSSEQSLSMTFNGDTASNYSATFLYGNGSSALSGRDTSNTLIPITRSDTNAFWGGTVSIQNYSNSSTYKTALSRGNSGTIIISHVGLWRSTAAITSITISGLSGNSFAAGSTFDLYGIGVVPKATGGDSIVNDGNYWYHVFKSTAAFVPIKTLSADVLVVAGGGSQGAYYGAAGGAGGLRGLTSQSFALGTSYTCTVGAGGASTGANTSSRGNNGTNSSIIGGALSISATGGGGGAGAYTGLPYAGGSGGGGNSYSGIMAGGAGNAGGYTPVEGYAGEQGNSASPNFGGAGGGAGQTGGTNGSGIGGDGSSAYSSWGLATGTGENVSGTVYYAGGGCGNTSTKTGGKGGGGRNPSTGGGGSYTWVGWPNTGGGSGSAADNNGYAAGSGIIIVRYAV